MSAHPSLPRYRRPDGALWVSERIPPIFCPGFDVEWHGPESLYMSAPGIGRSDLMATTHAAMALLSHMSKATAAMIEVGPYQVFVRLTSQ